VSLVLRAARRPRSRAETVEVLEGDLALFDRVEGVKRKVWSPAEKRHLHAQFVYIAAERGKNPGWASHLFREKFGHFPRDRFVEPIPPSAETRSWVRSRLISYAKSRERAGAA
jgi:hypothetical protein